MGTKNEVKFFQVGIGLTNAPAGWSYFSIVKVGERAIAFSSLSPNPIAVNYLSNGQKWSGWVEVPSKSYVDRAVLKRITGEILGDITIPASGYVKITPPMVSGTILMASVRTWSEATGAFSLAVSSNESAFVYGTPGVTVKGLTPMYWYM